MSQFSTYIDIEKNALGTGIKFSSLLMLSRLGCEGYYLAKANKDY